MQVNNNAQVYSINQIRNNNSTHATEVSNVATTQTENDIVSISKVGKNAEKKWQNIANKYDVSNMSQTEIGKMTKELDDNKLIPKGVLLHMLAPASMNQDPDQKYNILSRMRDSFEFSKNIGVNQNQLEMQRQVVEVFDLLNELRSSDLES